MPTKTYAFTHGPYKTHYSIREFFITPTLWFHHHLKGTFTVPSTPSVSIDCSGDKTFVSVFPDVSREVDSVIVHFYYHNPELHPRERRWGMGVKGVRANDNEWTFTLPAQIEDRQMWVFANVFYPLGKEMTGTNWAGKTMNTDRFGVSSDLKIIEANQSH